MTNSLVRILISTCTAYVLFAHLKIEARPSEPTLQDWVGTHEAYPVTEALVSDPTVDASVPSGSSKTVMSFTDSSVETTVSLTALITFARRVFLSE